MVSNGDLVQVETCYGTREYIAITHTENDIKMYLLLSLKTLNRKEDFVTKLPKYNKIGGKKAVITRELEDEEWTVFGGTDSE